MRISDWSSDVCSSDLVLNHTDLSRDGGLSGDIDLGHVNWGNYDLVVIDESHNFRNKATHKDRDTRYDHLMKRIIKAGVKTKVLMLSATPVNNRLRSEEHTSELQSLMRISYAVFCLKKKN